MLSFYPPHDITACLAISKQYGLKSSISKIREVAGTDKQGTNAYSVIKAAEKLGTNKSHYVMKEAKISHVQNPLMISEKMNSILSISDVRNKISHMISKFNVKGRTELAIYALENDYV